MLREMFSLQLAMSVASTHVPFAGTSATPWAERLTADKRTRY